VLRDDHSISFFAQLTRVFGQVLFQSLAHQARTAGARADSTTLLAQDAVYGPNLLRGYGYGNGNHNGDSNRRTAATPGSEQKAAESWCCAGNSSPTEAPSRDVQELEQRLVSFGKPGVLEQVPHLVGIEHGIGLHAQHRGDEPQREATPG